MYTIPSFRAKLAPLLPFLDDPKVTEIAINRPGEVWLGLQGQRYMECAELPALTYDTLNSLAEVTGANSDQSSSKKKPLLSATIPINLDDGVPDHERGGYRVQMIRAPVVATNTIALCIRKPSLLDLSLDDYEAQGAFDLVNTKVSEEEYSDDRLKDLYISGQWKEFLRVAVRAHKNIIISAGTNTGKTTLLNTLLKAIPAEERIVTIEDAREVRPRQRNCLHLVYSRGNQGVADVTAVDLLEAMLRLTPDRPIMGELRGAEAFAYLELLNSGHTGSITSIHADSPALMFDRLAQMVLRFGSTLNKDQIIEYARSLIQVVIQFKRGHDGRRYVSEIEYVDM